MLALQRWLVEEMYDTYWLAMVVKGIACAIPLLLYLIR